MITNLPLDLSLQPQQADPDSEMRRLGVNKAGFHNIIDNLEKNIVIRILDLEQQTQNLGTYSTKNQNAEALLICATQSLRIVLRSFLSLYATFPEHFSVDDEVSDKSDIDKAVRIRAFAQKASLNADKLLSHWNQYAACITELNQDITNQYISINPSDNSESVMVDCGSAKAVRVNSAGYFLRMTMLRYLVVFNIEIKQVFAALQTDAKVRQYCEKILNYVQCVHTYAEKLVYNYSLISLAGSDELRAKLMQQSRVKDHSNINGTGDSGGPIRGSGEGKSAATRKVLQGLMTYSNSRCMSAGTNADANIVKSVDTRRMHGGSNASRSLMLNSRKFAIERLMLDLSGVR